MQGFHFFLLFLTVSAVMVATEPIFLGGLLLVKGAILKGKIIGGLLSRKRGRGRKRKGGKRRRYRRGAVEDEGEEDVLTEKEILDELFLRATMQDVDDCAKKFVCLVNSRDAAGEGLDSMERTVVSLFEGEKGFLDASAGSARFQLAAIMGRVAGASQCDRIYARCTLPYRDMAKFMEAVPVPDVGANLVN